MQEAEFGNRRARTPRPAKPSKLAIYRSRPLAVLRSAAHPPPATTPWRPHPRFHHQLLPLSSPEPFSPRFADRASLFARLGRKRLRSPKSLSRPHRRAETVLGRRPQIVARGAPATSGGSNGASLKKRGLVPHRQIFRPAPAPPALQAVRYLFPAVCAIQVELVFKESVVEK